MKTTVYFIRHAEPLRHAENLGTDYTDATYPLTYKGLADCALVSHFLRDKKIDVILSSPFKRSYDTVLPFAQELGVSIEVINDFRERRVTHENVWLENFKTYCENQWADFSYKLTDGESLAEVQARNIAALYKVLEKYRGKNIVIATHGTALSTMINYFDPSYGVTEFWDMVGRMPWAVKMIFNNGNAPNVENFPKNVSIEKFDLFAQTKAAGACYSYNTFAALDSTIPYYYAVMCARKAVQLNGTLQWQWLFVRHKDRNTWELPGGGIEAHETPAEGAARELREETGAQKFHLFPAFDYMAQFPRKLNDQNNNAQKKISRAGQVFLADIETFGELPADSEIAEMRAFSIHDIPDETENPQFFTYPTVHPLIFKTMQKWLAQNTTDEYWDLLDENRNPLGLTHKRGEPMPPNAFHTVVRTWVVNAKGQFLCTRRALSKMGAPGLWEVPTGSASAGETSLQAALRELHEESGIVVPPECGTLLCTVRYDDTFWDKWLFRYEYDLADVVLQEGETMDARAMTLDEIDDLYTKDKFVGHHEERDELVKELKKSFM